MMNPIEKMEINRSKFTKTDNKIYDFIKTDIHDFLRASTTVLSEKYGLSQASITRFAKKNGYSGFNDLRFALYNYNKKDLVQHSSDRPSLLGLYAKLIETMESVIDLEQVDSMAETIANAKTVTLTGITKSFLPAKMLQQILMKLSIPAISISYDEAFLVRNYLTESDTVILFSAASQIIDHDFITEIKQETAATVIVITMTEKKSIRELVDYYVWLPSAQNQSYPTYIENEIIFMVFADFLSSFIAQKIKK
ncbi:MurR/RpiR family transcriptional regulator [Enterococcus sp. AZ109]|uniref:MurR/RpiR family transcriptional regulator n=1 Tax=Enterococcus sp. AZ109 TaxID=2774634 RepID=UPI003F1F10D1